MNAREKLIELLEPHMSGLACEYESGSCELTSCRSCNARNIADHLIAHGVTVQEWIPVKDRLPDKPMKCLVYTKRGECGGYEITYYNQGFNLQYSNVTHWMPLPEPPKGE